MEGLSDGLSPNDIEMLKDLQSQISMNLNPMPNSGEKVKLMHFVNNIGGGEECTLHEIFYWCIW